MKILLALCAFTIFIVFDFYLGYYFANQLEKILNERYEIFLKLSKTKKVLIATIWTILSLVSMFAFGW